MSDFSPKSAWFKAGTDIEVGEEKVVTIRSLVEEEVGQDKELKWVLSFKESDKKLVLNKTAQTNLALATGTTESDEVVGKKITLYVEEGVRNPKGGTVDAVRISKKAPAASKKAAKPVESSDDEDLGI